MDMHLVLVESPYAPTTPAPTAPCSCDGPALEPRIPCETCVITQQRAAEVERNLRYVRAAMADCFARGEAPFASHALYTQPGVLRDDVPAERRLGIEAGLTWGRAAAKSNFYVDLGWTSGMRLGLERATAEGRAIEVRRLGAPWSEG